MDELIAQLHTRRKIGSLAVFFSVLVAIVVSLTIDITPSFELEAYGLMIVEALFAYKVIELFVIYYLLIHRYIREPLSQSFDKMVKHSKLFYFLVPQGNIVFGMIAFKVSGDVRYFLFFSLIALFVLLIMNPNKLYFNMSHRI